MELAGSNLKKKKAEWNKILNIRSGLQKLYGVPNNQVNPSHCSDGLFWGEVVEGMGK